EPRPGAVSLTVGRRDGLRGEASRLLEQTCDQFRLCVGERVERGQVGQRGDVLEHETDVTQGRGVGVHAFERTGGSGDGPGRTGAPGRVAPGGWETSPGWAGRRAPAVRRRRTVTLGVRRSSLVACPDPPVPCPARSSVPPA